MTSQEGNLYLSETDSHGKFTKDEGHRVIKFFEQVGDEGL